MSYIPTIIISFDDLKLQVDEHHCFDTAYFTDEEKEHDLDKWAAAFLKDVYEFNVRHKEMLPELKGIKMLLVAPDLSKRSLAVREWLDAHNVAYTLDN